MRSKKVLVIGVDSMDPKITEKLIAAGKLPNFSKLNYKKLGTTIPPETPVAWSSAATGLNPGGYGIFDFLGREAGTYTPRLMLTKEKPGLIKTEYTSALQGKTFWQHLTEADIPVTVIRWPVTFPAEKIKGRMISGLGVVDIRGTLGNYQYITTDAAKAAGEGQEKVSVIELQNNEAQVEIKGPLVRKRGTLRAIAAEAKLTVEPEQVTLQVGDEKHTLRVGEWSDFVRLKFRVLPLMDVFGICNMYLEEAAPFLKLYVSSIQIDPENQAQQITSPKEYGQELVKKVGLFHTLGMPEDTKAVTEGRLPVQAFCEQIAKLESEREAMFWYEFERFEDGALACVFDSGDRLTHIFWDGYEEDGSVRIAPEVEKYFVEKDQFLGKVLERIDEDTTLLVCSDHGFESFTRQVNVNTWLLQNGYLSGEESELGDLYAGVNWAETAAYSLGFTSIFLNRQGRDPEGMLKEDEVDAIAHEIISGLEALEDNGKKVVTKVYKASEVYSGEFLDSAPDLIVGFERGYRMAWKNAVGGFDEEVIADNDQAWKGDHLMDVNHVPGVLFANFPVARDTPQLADIAPTILAELGVQVDADFSGESLR